jgi:hypothetical protein
MTINKIPCAILPVFTMNNLWVEKEAMTEKVHKSEVPFCISNKFYNVAVQIKTSYSRNNGLGITGTDVTPSGVTSKAQSLVLSTIFTESCVKSGWGPKSQFHSRWTKDRKTSLVYNIRQASKSL